MTCFKVEHSLSISVRSKLYSKLCILRIVKTEIYWPWELPPTLEGTAVIIDINAATTNICMILARKAKNLFIVNSTNVVEIKERNPGCLVTGESDSLPHDFFDANNCTNVIARLPIEHKTTLYMSNNGSRTIELAIQKKATNVLVCSFTNIHRVVQWMKEHSAEKVYIIPSGEKKFTNPKVVEDQVCAEAVKALISGNPVDWNMLFNRVKKFIRESYDDFSEEETAMQFSLDSYPVLPLCMRDERGLIKVDNLSTT